MVNEHLKVLEIVGPNSSLGGVENLKPYYVALEHDANTTYELWENEEWGVIRVFDLDAGQAVTVTIYKSRVKAKEAYDKLLSKLLHYSLTALNGKIHGL